MTSEGVSITVFIDSCSFARSFLVIFVTAVISAVTADTCTASYLLERGHGHFFYDLRPMIPYNQFFGARLA